MCCLIYKFLLILTQKMQISFLKILPENALKFVSKKMRICVKNFAQLQHAFEFRLEEYKKGQNIKVEKTENEYFYKLFLNWKDTTKIENSDRKKILDHIDNLMKKRVEAIMGANRRNYYGECAAYIAAIGEVKEKLGEKNAKQIYMSHYADMYTRRSAFKSELKSYGWIKR